MVKKKKFNLIFFFKHEHLLVSLPGHQTRACSHLVIEYHQTFFFFNTKGIFFAGRRASGGGVRERRGIETNFFFAVDAVTSPSRFLCVLGAGVEEGEGKKNSTENNIFLNGSNFS